MKKSIITLALLLAGCEPYFYRNLEGEYDTIALTVPNEEVLKLEVVSHLNGQSVKVQSPSVITHQWESSSTNTYFGLVSVKETRKGLVTVNPFTNIVDRAEQSDK